MGRVFEKVTLVFELNSSSRMVKIPEGLMVANEISPTNIESRSLGGIEVMILFTTCVHMCSMYFGA
eukprot:1364970-Amorphochlora_amoeboformis.AAC.1